MKNIFLIQKLLKATILSMLLVSTSLNAETKAAKQKALACPTKPMYKEFVKAVNQDFWSALEIYVNQGCYIIAIGDEITFIESDWGTIKVIHKAIDGKKRLVWTAREIYF